MVSISDLKNVKSLEDLKAIFGLVPYMIGDEVIDIISDLTVDHNFNITSKPIEEGFLTNSRIKEPIEINLVGILTNNLENLSVSSAIKAAVSGGINLDSWKQKRESLLAAKDENILLEIVTPDKIYPDMMLSSISFLQSSAMDACYFEASFVEVKIFSTATSFVSDAEIPKKLEEKQTEEKKADSKKSKRRAGKAAETIQKPPGGHAV